MHSKSSLASHLNNLEDTTVLRVRCEEPGVHTLGADVDLDAEGVWVELHGELFAELHSNRRGGRAHVRDIDLPTFELLEEKA